MNYFTRAFAMLVLAASFAIIGCSSKNTPVVVSSPDQAYFADVANGNEASTKDIATSDQSAMQDGQMYDAAMQSIPKGIQSVADDHDMHPVRWGRYISGTNRVITKIDMEDDSVAIVHVQVTYSGTYVVFGMVNNMPDTIHKPFTEVLHRLFRFVRIANKEEARLNWRLDAVSILNGGTSTTKIIITQMQVLQPTGQLFAATDPDAYFMHISKGGWFMHDLPLLGINLQVVVTATVHSMDRDSDVVTLHYVPKGEGLHRAKMNMISQSGDSVRGFVRVYSRAINIPANDKKFSHLVVTATTHESVTSTTTTDFSSVTWGLPYKSSE